jgi:DNA repair exonuclease SbcCD ATPase subunit
MTEVWEDKLKSSSENAEEQDHSKPKVEKDTSQEKNQGDVKTCRLCGKIFKNDRALKTHEHHCKRKKNAERTDGKKVAEDVSDINKLRDELKQDMKLIKEERRLLEKERASLREEIESERTRMKDTVTQEFSDKRGETERTLEKAPHEETDGKDGTGSGVAISEEDTEEYQMDEMEGELDAMDPSIAKIGDGVTELDLEELTMQLESIESELTSKVDMVALTKMSEDYGKSMVNLEGSINSINHKVDNVINDMEERSKRFGTFQSVVRELERLDEKNIEILEEIGFGESLNVTKIPPNILESVYESTMEGAVTEIHRNYGTHDAERIIKRAIEDVRTRTSGSELFYFDGRMLKTRKLAQSISAKLISAKQVQTTYDELLKKLLEYIPGYKARNFRAMIKLKSQEYAVDKTTLLLENLNSLKDDIENLKTMFGTISNRQNSIEIEINSLIGSKVGKEEIEGIQNLSKNIRDKQEELDETLRVLKEERKQEKEDLSKRLGAIVNKINGKVSLPSKEKSKEKKKEVPSIPKIEMKVKEEKKQLKPMIEGIMVLDDKDDDMGEGRKKGGVKVPKEETVDKIELNEEENQIIDKIPEKGYTLSRINKEILPDLTEDKVKKCLNSLIDKGAMSTTKRGRHIIYIKKGQT